MQSRQGKGKGQLVRSYWLQLYQREHTVYDIVPTIQGETSAMRFESNNISSK